MNEAENNTKVWPTEGKEQTFTGILESADITTPMDGSTDKVVVSGRTVVIREGGMRAKPVGAAPAVWGTSEIGYDDIPIGAKIEVRAFCPLVDHCTLEGKTDYYLKIISKN